MIFYFFCRIFVGVIGDNFIDKLEILEFGNVYVCLVNFNVDVKCFILLNLWIVGKIYFYIEFKFICVFLR